MSFLGYAWVGLVLLSTWLFVWMIRGTQEFVPDIGSARAGALGLFVFGYLILLWWLVISLVNGMLWVSTLPKWGVLRYAWMPFLILVGYGLAIAVWVRLVDYATSPYPTMAERQSAVIYIAVLYAGIVLVNLFWLWRFRG